MVKAPVPNEVLIDPLQLPEKFRTLTPPPPPPLPPEAKIAVGETMPVHAIMIAKSPVLSTARSDLVFFIMCFGGLSVFCFCLLESVQFMGVSRYARFWPL